MNSFELMESLKNKTIFNLSDLERITFSKKNYSKLVLTRLKKRGIIKRVSRNAYTTKGNVYVISSNIINPSYISFWSASSFLGYTDQILNTVQIATTKKYKNIRFENYLIKFIPMKHFFGYKKINTQEGEIFIVEDEKLLIDCFFRYKEIGNFDEITKIFENVRISEKKIIDYLKKINNQTLIKRVGYLLEDRLKIDLSKNFKLDRNYVFLNPFSRKEKKINSKWRVKI